MERWPWPVVRCGFPRRLSCCCLRGAPVLWQRGRIKQWGRRFRLPRPSPSRPCDILHMPFCTNCGSQVPDGGRFCARCGQAVGAAVANAAPAPEPLDYTIQGDNLQVARVRLKPGQEVYAEAGKMVYKTASVEWETRMSGSTLGEKLLGALRRTVTGES